MNKEQARLYLKKNNLIQYFKRCEKGQLEPDYCDLSRLHQLIISRKVFTVLEFGLGWSTIILADALRINEKKWKEYKKKNDLRVNDPFKIFTVDSSKKWIEVVKKTIPLKLKKYVKISYSEVEAESINGRMCHFYKSIPNIVPDFIYLDGPDPTDVKGVIRGMTWKNLERTVMSGDIISMEPTFLPRTFVVIDGRTNNARFLENNLQRKWVVNHDKKEDVTTMELMETPLGEINKEKILYCLGKINTR